MIEIKDLYWLAGILEGEGTFTLDSKSKYPKFKISLGMTDKDIVERCYNIAKIGGVSKGSLTSTGKVVWHWQIGSASDVAALMMTLYPIMGNRRQERIKELLLMWRDDPLRRHRPGTCEHGNRNIYVSPKGQRQCRDCMKASKLRRDWAKVVNYFNDNQEGR